MCRIRPSTMKGISEPLTERELQILQCLIDGLSNGEIAAQLHLALRTVKWYNSQIYSKLQAKNRREAVELAASLGLLQPAGEGISTAPTHNLPAELTAFIGRHREIAELSQLLERDETRLITIQGAGGMGKTSLAIAVARRQMHHYADGIFFIPLVSLQSPEHIALEIANALGYVFSGADSPKDQLVTFLHKKRLLLLLDNFEHLIQDATLLVDILKDAPHIKIVVTSREKLRLQGETSFQIGGMEIPTQTYVGNILNCDSVALFVDTMHRTRADIDTDPVNINAITRICQLVGGMPLAIQLAAAWVDVLSLDEIADEISQSFDTLAAEGHEVLDRHHSIRAVFDQSWNRLTPEQQAVFMKLSVFRGGWAREAAQNVAGTSLPVLQALVNKSLIWRLPTGRYEIHELLRQYADDKLEASETAHDIRDIHSQYYLGLLHQREPDIKDHRQIEVLNEIDAEHENIFTAWRWGIEAGDAEAIGKGIETLAIYAQIHTCEREVEALATQAMERFTADNYPRVWERVAIRHARVIMSGTFARQGLSLELAVVEQCLASAEKLGDSKEIAICKLTLASFSRLDFIKSHLQIEHIIILLGEALAFYEEIGDQYYRSLTLKWLGWMVSNRQASHDYIVKSVEVARTAGIANQTLWSLGGMGFHDFTIGRFSDYENALWEVLNLASTLKDRKYYTRSLTDLSFLEFLTGKFTQARDHAEDGLRRADRIGDPWSKTVGLAVLALLSTIQQEAAPEARKLSDEAITINAGPFETIFTALIAKMVVAYVLRDSRSAWTDALQRLKESVAQAWLPHAIACLTVIALLLADDGEHAERVHAARLLGLTFSHSASPRGWLDNWPLLTHKREQLQAELGSDRYLAAWEEGHMLDLETVASQLLTHYT